VRVVEMRGLGALKICEKRYRSVYGDGDMREEEKKKKTAACHLNS
jgi:nitroimidazol reductase NimA-like FMN-containing flavoprotein (pyridoxamine 5'-phosphate oxidase superfamily)